MEYEKFENDMETLMNLFNFVSRGREVAYLAGLITLKSVVRIHPNATKNLLEGSSALKQDEGPNGHRCLPECKQQNGSQDRHILALADNSFQKEAQIISGLFSFTKLLSV